MIKNQQKILIPPALIFIVIFFISCTTPAPDHTSSSSTSSGTGASNSSIVTTTLTNSITLISVPGGIAALQARPVALSKFYIGKYLVTYAQWNEVHSWAISNGYTFANLGVDGDNGARTPADPVTTISWRDAIIWCNALSQKEGLTPVYCTDAGYTIPLKTVDASSTTTTAAGSEDNPYVNWSSVAGFVANGYRLPTEAEYEWAARGGNPADTTNWSYTYAGSDTVTDVAWDANDSTDASHPAGGTHPVGGLQANSLSLYDMSGDAWEWCWDWSGTIGTSAEINPAGPSSGTQRILRGGSWFASDIQCYVVFRNSDFTAFTRFDIGFRVAKGN